MIRGITEESRIELDAAFAEAAVQESAWEAARHAPPVAAAPVGRPARRLPPRPAWFSGDTVDVGVHRATAGALGQLAVRRR